MKDIFFKQATDTVVLHNFMSAMGSGCTRCTLSDGKCDPIVYRGNPEADILLVGEAPGKVEQEKGKPFVGPAGKLLDNIMLSIGLDTNKDMCITNSVYCRPTAPYLSGKQNYTPKQEQLEKCQPFVKSFAYIVRPKVIIACGRTALSQISGDPDIRLGEHEGLWRYARWLPVKHNPPGATPMFVMTHPAAILHMGKDPEAQTEKKKQVWKYMQEFRDSWKER